MNEEWVRMAASWAGLGVLFLILVFVVVVAIVLGAKRLFFICLELSVGLIMLAVLEDSRSD